MLFVGFALLLGCSQPKNTRTDAIEGRPPTPDDDPFFFVALPAEAVKVDTRGTIGSDSTQPAETNVKSSADPGKLDPELAVQQAARLEAARQEAAELRAELEVERQKAQRSEVARRDADQLRTQLEDARREVAALKLAREAGSKSPAATPRDPDKNADAQANRTLPDRDPPRNQCFSCVKICMVEGKELRCDDHEDVICGWGVHPDRPTSAKVAQAQCDGALDVARDSRRLARIEGSCPIATCQ